MPALIWKDPVVEPGLFFSLSGFEWRYQGVDFESGVVVIKVYEYAKCDTCRKALKYLDSNDISYQKIPIVEQPPTATELRKMLEHLKRAGGSFRNLFNTSGVQYRELDVSGKIKAGMTEAEAITLLSKNGKLIKRPFLLTDKGGAVGFSPQIWQEIL